MQTPSAGNDATQLDETLQK